MDDFQKLGIALADARLLVEKFKANDNASELSDLLTSVRSKGPAKRKKVIRHYNVEFAWYDWCAPKKRYSVVQQKYGGGARKNKFSCDSTLKDLCKFAADLYFPNGKSAKKQYLSLMVTDMCSPDMTQIENMDMSLQEFIEMKSLKVVRFIFKTKFYSFNTSDDDDSDFQIAESTPAESTPKQGITNHTKAKNLNEESKAQNKNSHPVKSDAVQIREEQNEEFKKCLEIDREKDRQKKIEKEKKKEAEDRKLSHDQYLKQRQEARKSLLLPEPDLTDDCVLVVVNHMTLGRKERFFLSSENCESIYNWVGSLAPEPELFRVSMAPNIVIQPDWEISKVDRNVLVMFGIDSSDFTMDIYMNKNEDLSITESTPSGISTTEYSPSSGISTTTGLLCPVCSKRQAPGELEAHATNCAENKYLEVAI